MSAGSNNPMLIEQQIEVLTDYQKNIEKTIDDINEKIQYLNIINEKLVDDFNDNMPINARNILTYIYKINDDIDEINDDANFKYLLQQLENLNEHTKDLKNYFNKVYMETVNKN